MYLEADKFQYARQAYDRLLEVRPNDVLALSMIAQMHHTKNDTAKAKRAYERVLAVDPRAAVAANNLAYLYAESGENLDVALSLAQMAKAAQPDDPDVNDTLGLVYLRRNLPALALEPVQQSVKANPRNALYQYRLGQVYLQLGETAKARAAFEQTLRLEPEFEHAADVRKALAQIQ